MKRAYIFAPLIILYVVIALVAPAEQGRSDEARYIWFAGNIAKGYYSPADQVNLWSGPGYPILLAPFAALDVPWRFARLINAILMFLGSVYLYSTLRIFVSHRLAVLTTYLVGLFPALLFLVPRLYTEPLAFLLVSAFMFHSSRGLRDGAPSRHHLFIAAAYLAYLALTRVLFGYVIAVGIIAALILCLLVRGSKPRKTLLIYGFALILCLPYLFYTYSLTGKPFYWAMSGGLSLYWMSTPHEGEHGDWIPAGRVRRTPELNRNHKAFFEEISILAPIEADDALKARALENIRSNPDKYFRNWLANVGRLFCNCPYSYKKQAPFSYTRIIPGIVVLCLIGASVCLKISKRRRIAYEVYALGAFAFIALGGSSLLSAFNRFLIPILPAIALWVAVTLPRATDMGSE